MSIGLLLSGRHTLDGDGGTDLAVKARIRNGGMKFPTAFAIFDIQSSPARDERSGV